MPTSPTQRTLQALRKKGYTCAITEKWNPHAHIRQDLFQILDLLCLAKDEILGIQCTTYAHHADHKTKIINHENTRIWLNAGGKLEIWSWKKTMKGKRVAYESRVEEITLDDLPIKKQEAFKLEGEEV